MYKCNYTTLINYISFTNKITYSYEYNFYYTIICIRIGVIILKWLYKWLIVFLYSKYKKQAILMPI